MEFLKSGEIDQLEKPRVRVPANLNGPAFTQDGLMNFVSRLGTGADKASHARYVLDPFFQNDLEAAYRTSWFRPICDIPPSDEVREGRSWKGADEDQITAIEDEQSRLDVMRKIREARTLARKDGGAVLLLGVGGNAAGELNIEAIGKDGFKYLTVCNRNEIQPGPRDEDVASPNFGQPQYWTLRTGTRVHYSRIIKFTGYPIRQLGYWDGWQAESIWVNLRKSVLDTDRIAAGIAAMVEEAKLDVISVKNFMANIITSDGEANLVKRFGALNTLKSMTNALVIDSDDTYEQKTLTFQGLTDIQQNAWMTMAGMAGIPQTRLLGRAPQGMNATGEGDLRNYYDRIKADQNNEIRPAITPLDDLLIRSALGDRPKEIFYEWNPLYQLSEKEAAEVENIYADATTKLVNSGVVPDTAMTEMVKGGIIERGQWPGAEKAFKDAETAGDEPGLTAEPTEAELAEEEARTAVAMATANDPAQMGSNRARLAANDARFTDATPRTLYVRRDVVNVAEITKWAKAQGFTDILPDLHVTIASSRAPIDWMKMGSDWDEEMKVPAGGPRIVDVLGTTSKFYVLLFASRMIEWRHEAAREAGASWDFPEFQPHISIQKGGDIDLKKVKPYTGKIILGPEIFEERKLD